MLTETTTQRIDSARAAVSAELPRVKRSVLGQFMTSATVARYMTSLFSLRPEAGVRLLDAGAGIGALSAAFFARWREHAYANSALDITAYEIDADLRAHLVPHLGMCQADAAEHHRVFTSAVLPYDFIQAATNPLEFGTRGGFTHAILNPPYKKINSDSMHRRWLRTNGIETVNLYSAFVALSLQLLVDGGELVAIVPRSFCNGPYYRPFREFILRHAAIEHLHLFDSRQKAFKDDDVLQENVILKLTRGKPQDIVTVSHCADDTFADYKERVCDFAEVVKLGDPERFIHIPPLSEPVASVSVKRFHHTLADLDLEISTGPVVDFRMKEYLRAMPGPGTVPLLYPCHCDGTQVTWPQPGSKKPNALTMHDETRRWLYPTGCYAVVRRFSSKEEKRRVVATVLRPSDLAGHAWIGFENHLNVFHRGKCGIPEDLAHGLCVYLNSTQLDQEFRAFNGHTQVNATDLRSLKYPNRQALTRLGRWLKQAGSATQVEIDVQVQALI